MAFEALARSYGVHLEKVVRKEQGGKRRATAIFRSNSKFFCTTPFSQNSIQNHGHETASAEAVSVYEFCRDSPPKSEGLFCRFRWHHGQKRYRTVYNPGAQGISIFVLAHGISSSFRFLPNHPTTKNIDARLCSPDCTILRT